MEEITHKGRIVAIDTIDNLLRSGAGTAGLTVTVAGPVSEVKQIIRGIEGVQAVTVSEDRDGEAVYRITTQPGDDVRSEISLSLARAGYPVTEMVAGERSLEDIFHELTTKGGK